MIRLKGLFANRSAFFQFGILFYLLIMGVILSSLVGFVMAILSATFTTGTPGSPSGFYTLHVAQFLSATFLFLMPAVGTAFLCSKQPAEFLYLRKTADAKILLLAALMIFLISPAIDITSYLNTKMHLPEFMAPVENWMRKAEDLAAGITDSLLSKQGVFPFITNLFVIAIMAGLTEEFLFRGALLSLIRKKIKNPHVAIWIVAIIFSAIHFQFFGFIPRMLLGAVLGYMLYWSGNIWVPVFAHFLNNAIAIIGYKVGLFENSSNSSTLITPDIGINEWIMTITAAIVGMVLFGICAKAMKKRSRFRE